MGKRRDQRIAVSIAVRVMGTDYNGNPFTQTARTVDVSRTGARLSGIKCLRGPGEMVTIECGPHAARFVVTWVGLPGTSEDGEFGVKALQPEKRIFRIDFGQPRADGYVPPESKKEEETVAVATSVARSEEWDRKERRGSQRVRCSGTGQITQPGGAFPIWTKVTDLSMGGCYLELVFTLPRHSPVDLKLTINGKTIVGKGTVTTSHPGIGIGVKFTSMDADNRIVLAEVVHELTTQKHPTLRVKRGAET